MQCTYLPRQKRRTPWGVANEATRFAPGIVFYSTPSHGGFHLSEHRQAYVESILPEFETFAKGPWYEEDCDACLVVVVWPEYFEPEAVQRARRQVEFMAKTRPWWAAVVRWLESKG